MNYKTYKGDKKAELTFSKIQDLRKWTDKHWEDFYSELKMRFPEGYKNNDDTGFIWGIMEYSYKTIYNYTLYLEIIRNKIYIRVFTNDNIELELSNFIWNSLEDNLEENFKKDKDIFNKSSGTIIAEIKGYETKNQLYKILSLVEHVYEILGSYLSGHHQVYIEDEKLHYIADNIGVIDGMVPKNLIINQDIMLITGISVDECRFIFELGEYVLFYIFEDRDSLDRFKKSLIQSKEYIEGWSSFADIKVFTSNKERMKVLKYVDGFDDIKESDDVLAFIDMDDKQIHKLKGSGEYVFIFRDVNMNKRADVYLVKEQEHL